MRGRSEGQRDRRTAEPKDRGSVVSRTAGSESQRICSIVNVFVTVTVGRWLLVRIDGNSHKSRETLGLGTYWGGGTT